MEKNKGGKLSPKNQDASLPSRIAKSASDLAKGFVSSSTAGSYATTATLAASATTEKSHAESSASGASKAIDSLPSRAIGDRSNSEVASSGFREQPAAKSLGQSDDILSDELQHFTTTSVDFSQWDANSRAHAQDPWFDHFQKGQFSNGGATPLGSDQHRVETTTSNFDARAFADYNDGSEVIALLNNHDFNENWEQQGFERDGIPEPAASDLFSQGRTAEEHEMANRLRAGLPLPSNHDGFNSGSHLNLLPNPEILLPASTAEDLTPEQREAWLQQWYSVLTNYTDEVWGDSLPHVREARQEIEQLQEQKDEYASKQAVRRLGMILGHVQTPQIQNISTKARGKRPVRFTDPPVNGTTE